MDRSIALMLSFTVLAGGIALVFYSRYIDNYLFEELYVYLNGQMYASENLPVHLYIHIFFTFAGVTITLTGLLLVAGIVSHRGGVESFDAITEMWKGILRFISLLFSGLLSALLIYLTFRSLVTPNGFFSYRDPKQVAAAQILACVGFAGMLGGIVKVIFSSRVIDDQTDMATFRVSFRKVIFNCVGSLFVACTSFLLIRAGVLKSVDVDTFNPYGVTGIAAVTGFFSDQIVTRLTTVYTNIFNIDSSKNKLDHDA